MGIGILAILIVLVVIFVVPRLSGRRIGRTPDRLSPRRRKIIRIAMVAVGASLLLVVTFATWRDLRTPYEVADGPVLTLRVPTQSIGEIAANHPEWHGVNRPVLNARLIVSVLLVDMSGPSPIVLNVDEHDANWTWELNDDNPQNRIVKKIDRPECEGTYTIAVRELLAWYSTAATPMSGLSGQVDIEWKSPGQRVNSNSGTPRGPVNAYVGPVRRPAWLELSMLPRLQERGYLTLLAYVNLAEDDDPLKSIPVTDLPEISNRDVSAQALEVGSMPAGMLWHAVEYTVPASRLLDRTGVSAFLLFGAALGLARLARRYALGVMLAVPAVVLLMVLADWTAVSAHSGHLLNDSATVKGRQRAARRAAGTFFFRRTASEAMTRVVDDLTQPEPLRNTARLLSRGLDAVAAPLHQPIGSTRSSTGYNQGLGIGIRQCLYRDKAGRPLLLCVQLSNTSSSTAWDVGYVAMSQMDSYRRIVTLDDQLAVQVIGTEADFDAAVVASERYDEQEADVWRNVILPALMPPPPDEAAQPAE